MSLEHGNPQVCAVGNEFAGDHVTGTGDFHVQTTNLAEGRGFAAGVGGCGGAERIYLVRPP